MSDDEAKEVLYVKTKKVVHYGSLEDKERARISGGSTAASLAEQAINTGIAAGNINVSSGETMTKSKKDDNSQDELVAEFERKKRVKQIIVSTDDTEVKAQLRELGEPICFFGEGPADRRERLRNLVADMGPEAKAARMPEEPEPTSEEKEMQTWYHEGSIGLRDARMWLTNYSIPRAKERLQRAREEAAIPEAQRQGAVADAVKRMRAMGIESSQIGDGRPLTCCEISPNGKMLATAGWTGLCKLWSLPECEEKMVLRGHENRVGNITFHPQATVSLEPSVCNMASCGQDGSVKLWSLESDEPVADIEGHAPYRVSKVKYHPSGRFIATCCADNSWRMWDLEAQDEILHQEGHSTIVHDVAFHPDGSLASTGGKDAYLRLWDLRSGRCIVTFLEGHLKAVTSIDFALNGYHLASGSDDHTCKVWDLRQAKCIYTIPAHTNLVSKVTFQKTSSHYLVTASFDGTAKIWAHPAWTPLRTLAGHEEKVTCVDVSSLDNCIVTTSWDRTFKLWVPDLA